MTQSNRLEFIVQPRQTLGKSVAKLRRDQAMIGNVVVKNADSVPIQGNSTNFAKLFAMAGESSLIYLKIEGDSKPRPTLIDEVSYHPVSNQLQHVVFRQVDLAEKVQAEIAIEQSGEFDVPEAVLVTVRDSIEVKALPAELPEKLTIDVGQFTEIGQSINVADLELDLDKVEVMLGEGMDPASTPLVLVQQQREEVEEPEPEVEAEVPEGEGDGQTSVDEAETTDQEDTQSSSE